MPSGSRVARELLGGGAGPLRRRGLRAHRLLPEALHLLHVAFEEVFARHVGSPDAELLEGRNLGCPAVKIDREFMRPLRFGEVLRVATEIPRVGRSSAVFHHVVRVGAEEAPRCEARFTRVAVDMQTLEPVPIPDDIRQRLGELMPTR